MNQAERWIIALVLFMIALLSTVDIYHDFNQGVALWHISIESLVALLALAGVYIVLRGRFRLQQTLVSEKQFSRELEIQAQKWKRVSKSYMSGLSSEIDNQLNQWGLTEAEKNVAFLLLKGFSIKEIATLRKTSVKTVRTQNNAIYSKSGLSGRTELSAFFLEDLLMPKAERALN
ncbi:MAG: helix-turn-helix transcriptional regulator [Cyclonatronaceae bacterium]